MNPKLIKELTYNGAYFGRRFFGTILTFFTYEMLREGKRRYKNGYKERVHKKYNRMIEKEKGRCYNVKSR